MVDSDSVGTPRAGGPVTSDDPSGSDLTFEEFGCPDARIVAIRDTSAPDRWIQSTLAVLVKQ
ncbi:MAG: hypothetical protein ABEJ40_03920 [Haloarculaceae archaeon]